MATAREEDASAREKTFEVVLRGGEPWGFEVSGGIGEGLPLLLSNVCENSKAWDSGLVNGDVVIQVNDIACLSSNEARQLINSAFRTLTLKLWRSSNTPERSTPRTASYRQRVEDARKRDLKTDVQDDSVVYNQSKSCQDQGIRMRPRTRRGESFNVKKPSRNRADQQSQDRTWQTQNTDSGQKLYENQQSNLRDPNQQTRESAYRSFRDAKLHTAKSSPSLNKLHVQVPTERHGGTISGAKSSPNLKNDCETDEYLSPKRSEYYNNNYERYSLDEPSHVNASWNLGSGDFKRSYFDQPPVKNMYDITDSYDKEVKQSKNSRRSLPPYILQKYQADYENISDFGTTPLRSEKISEIDDLDLDSDGDVPNIQILSSVKISDSHLSPQSPPIPPVRDPSSLKYVKINQSHEKYPSWPVTKPNSGTEQSQPINTRAQSWTDHTNTSKEFPGKQKLAYTPGLRPLPERNSPNSERRGEDGKIRVGSDPGLKSEFVYDKYGRVRQRNYENVDQNQIKRFYESKPGYPPPKLDSDGHNLGDEKYNVPSPPERDVPILDESEQFDKNKNVNKTVVRPTSFTNQTGNRGPSKLKYAVQGTISPMNSPIDSKGGHSPSSRPATDTKREKTMIDSCTSPQHSPKDSKSQALSTSSHDHQSPSSQIKSSKKAYIVKQTPYYNTSTQTEQSPTSYNMHVTIPKPAPRKNVSDFAVQTSPTSGDKNLFTNDKLVQSTDSRQSNEDYGQNAKRSNYADINSLTSRRESDNPSDKSSGNYADYSALRSNHTDRSHYQSIHQRYSSDIADDEDRKIENNIPHYSEYTASQAPILRELSKEFYKGRMPGSYDNKRVISPPESVRSSESVQPGMKEAESYSSVIIHPSESAGPFGRDDFGSRSSLSDSRQDIYSVVSESASCRSSIAKGRRSMDPTMLSNRSRPLHEQRYNSSSTVNHSRVVSSPTSDYRRPLRSSEASTPSQPKSSPDSRSSGSTYYSSSDTSQSRLLDLNLSVPEHRIEFNNDSVFIESKSPLPVETEQAKLQIKDQSVNVNLGRKPSMKKAYGIYDETERVLRGAAATLKAVNEAQILRKSGENFVPISRLSRGSSESKILDQIQEENDVFQDGDGQRSRSSSGRDEMGTKSSDTPKRDLFSGEYDLRKNSGMKRSTSEQMVRCVQKSGLDHNEHFKDSAPNLSQNESSVFQRLNTNDLSKQNSESDLKKIQQQAVLDFMVIKTGKRNSSSGCQDTENTSNRGSVNDMNDPLSPTQSVQDLISKTSENLANRTQRTDSFRRSGSSSSSRNSQDYMEMNKPRKETEWSRMRSHGVLCYGNELEGKSNRSSMCSENTYEDISVFSQTPRHSTHEKHKEEVEINLPDSPFDRNKPPSSSGMEFNLVSSPTYQNLFTARRRPPPPPPLLSPDDNPPALPPRNYRKPLIKNDPPSNKMSAPITTEDENVVIDNSKIDFKSLMNQWEGSPREDSYAADLRRQARRYSEQQQPNSTNMSILHSKTKINFSQSYKREPVLAHQATPPHTLHRSYEELNRVASPETEQPMVIEEGNKENTAPATPDKQPNIEEEMKTPPRVDRSMSELSLPSPPINYGISLETDNSELPPPPLEALVDENEDDAFADDSYGAYKNKKQRTPGLYKRSVSDANVCLQLENPEQKTEVVSGNVDKKKLGQNSWNSESSLNGCVSQPKRPRDFPCDTSGNVPAFKVENSVRNVIKGTAQPLVSPSNRYSSSVNKSQPNSAQFKQAMPKPNISAQRSVAKPPNSDKESVRNRIHSIETTPINSKTDSNHTVTAWLNKNESIANSPVNPDLQPKNIHENLNVQRSKTFNDPRSQQEATSVSRNILNQEEIKKRSTFNSPTPYGARPYQSSYSPGNESVSHVSPQSLSYNRPKEEGNKPIPQERVSTYTTNISRDNVNNDKNTSNNNIEHVLPLKSAESSWNSATGNCEKLTSSAVSSQRSEDLLKGKNGDNIRVNNVLNNDNLSQLKTKGGYFSDINRPNREVNKGVNSPVQSNDQSFVFSSNSAKRSSPSQIVSLSPNTNNSPKTVQSNDSQLSRNTSSSCLPPGTICHGRQRSQEELECDQKAKELAKELVVQDKKLSDVLIQDSNTKRMQYMNGLFIEPVQPRKLSSDESERKNSREENSPSHRIQNNLDNSAPLHASYFHSPPKALMEMELRNNEEMSRDITKDINDNSGLVKQKEELMEKLYKKLDVLRTEKLSLQDEITDNENLGDKVEAKVNIQCQLQSEREKFKSFIQDQEKIVRLLLNLSGQLARAENAVQSLETSTNPKIKKMTKDKRERLHEKHEEAKLLKDDIDKRSNLVTAMLENRLSSEDIEDYNYYIKMKSKLTIDFQELEDRIKLGEEQIQELKKSIPESKSVS